MVHFAVRRLLAMNDGAPPVVANGEQNVGHIGCSVYWNRVYRSDDHVAP